MKSGNISHYIFFNESIWQSIYPSVYFLMNIFGAIIYTIWLIHLISRFLTFRTLRRSIGENEIFEMKYRCKTEYYKYALFIVITIIEPLNFIPHALAYGAKLSTLHMNQTTSVSLATFSICLSLKSSSYVFGLVTASLLNIITIYMSYVYHSYTEFGPLKRRLRNSVILAVVLMLSSFILVIGALIVQLVCILICIYEMNQLFKNSKYLYKLIRDHYQNLITENYSLYRKYKYTAKRYKWMTIILFIFGAMIVLSYSCDFLNSFLKLFIIFSSGRQTKTQTDMYRYICKGIDRISGIMIGITASFMLIIFFIVTIHFIIRNRSKEMSSRETKSRLREPLLS